MRKAPEGALRREVGKLRGYFINAIIVTKLITAIHTTDTIFKQIIL